MTVYTALDSPVSAQDEDTTTTHPEPFRTILGTLTSKGEIRTVPLRELFSYADDKDKLFMIVGTLGAFAAGVSQPIQIVLLGDILNSFNPSSPSADLTENVNDVVLNFVYVGIVAFVCGFLQVACWSATAACQAKRIRSEYVRAVMSKEIAWFDLNDPMQIPAKVVEATIAIQEGIGRRLADGLHFFAMALSGVVIGAVKGWELALVLLAFTPFIALTAFVCMKAMKSAALSGVESYGKAGAIAQEALNNVRTVHSFNANEYFVKKYNEALVVAVRAGIKKGLTVGWGTGIMYFVVFCTYACGMFYGAVKVANDRLDGNTCVGSGCYDGGRVIVVFFSIINGAMVLGRAGPSVEAISSAKVAAYEVFQTIKRSSLIDPLSNEGEVLNKASGRIEISDVTFAYPSRLKTQVCCNYSLSIEAGETVALVGPSGSGKSTIVALLERFYDPLQGSVKLDGVDLRGLNVKWLRQQIGLVGQEPTLFANTIVENIRHGSPFATDDQVVEAAKLANAYEFIVEFPQGFATEVGERGAQLSGGQKQRIAIARAIIKNPPILILDEATSALDAESEQAVQEALIRLTAHSKRTTILIAHNLLTIRDADRIAVHNDGAIVEVGTHNELMKVSDGKYRRLVDEQLQSSERGLRTDSIRGSDEQLGKKIGIAEQACQMRESNNQEELEHVATEKSHRLISTRRIWMHSLPDWRFLGIGTVGAVANAAVFPVWGLIFTKITVLFYAYTKTKREMLHDAGDWALGFVGLGIVFGFSVTMQNFGFAVTSQRLIARVRSLTFGAMLHQEIGWFDRTENSPGALVSRLAADSAVLQIMTSEALNHRLVNITTIGIALGISLFHSWHMTLVILAACPILVLAFYIQGQQMSGAASNKKNNEADAVAASVLHESISSIRTVASLGMEHNIVTRYTKCLEMSNNTDVRNGLLGGLTFGLSLGMTFMFFAFLFYIAGIWVDNGTVNFEDAFIVLMVIMLSMFAVGMAAQDATTTVAVKSSAQRVFDIIDRAPEIDAASSSGQILPQVKGDITFQNLRFRYPSRSEIEIYRDFTLNVHRGQTVALVGASGCGKSTAIALLERFYDPLSGVVTLDGTNLRLLNARWLRERIALVSQEPVLFSGTIADNIKLGKPNATREELMEAAKIANAFDFIANFPDGFDTAVGECGVQVSGGQKQRIAIARAVLRDADVLLLDEATSALDSESERLVQESLDQLLELKQRTTVIVAHRLSTIRRADVIAVLGNGGVVEQGTHDQLMQIPSGIYKSLVARQTQLM